MYPDHMLSLHPTEETCNQTPGRHVWPREVIPPNDDDLCICRRHTYSDYLGELLMKNYGQLTIDSRV